MQIRNIFRRLDTQLSAIIAAIVVLWFASFLYTSHLLHKEKTQKAIALEEEKINSRLELEKTSILNDILLDHYSALTLAIKDIHRQLALCKTQITTVSGFTLTEGDVPHRKSTHTIEKVIPIEFSGKEYGSLKIMKEVVLPEEIEARQVKWMWGIGLALVAIFLIVRTFIARQIMNPINSLVSRFESDFESTDSAWIQPRSVEMERLVDSFRHLKQAVCEYQGKMVAAERKAALVTLASQVAHDIRSPLSALAVSLNDLSSTTEDQRIMVRSAVSRIQDIANSLLDRTREESRLQDLGGGRSNNHSVELLPSLIDNLVSEKRTEHRTRLGVQLIWSIDEGAYGLFARIQPPEFKRVISNIINNAFEAISGKGHVTVSLREHDRWVEIAVSDNGKGIPDDILPKLMTEGFSHDKPSGSGSGLYDAKLKVKAWGGEILLTSKEKKGATVTVKLPKACAPIWFVPSLRISKNATIVILDDDISVHHIWQKRFESLNSEHGLQVVHFSTTKELKDWYQNEKPSGHIQYLIDYELIGQSENGLEIIEALGIKNGSILVTSRYEEKKVLEQCLKLGVPLIPKAMAGFVPISIRHSLADCILIDDAITTHLSWKASARKAGKTLRSYSSPKEFFDELTNIDRDIPIYVDSQLADGERGELVAKKIYEFGFRNIYLTTGFTDIDLSKTPWLSGCIGKEPPWHQADQTQKERENETHR